MKGHLNQLYISFTIYNSHVISIFTGFPRLFRWVPPAAKASGACAATDRPADQRPCPLDHLEPMVNGPWLMAHG